MSGQTANLEQGSGTGKSSFRPAGHFPTLDGWRAIAILTVMVHHAADSIKEAFPASRVANWVATFFHNQGRYGVNVFFGLSGFLICSRLLFELRKHGKINLRAFYTRRGFRILPPLILFLGIVGILGAVGIVPIRLGQWLAALAFCANYYFGPRTWYLGHFWSLAVEEHFYLLWPGVLVLLGVKRALRFGIVLAILVGAWRVCDLLAVKLPDGIFRTDTQLDGLMWGCVAAIVYEQQVWRLRIQKVTSGWRLSVCLFAGALVIGLSYWVAKTTFALPSGHFKTIFSPFVAFLVPFLLVATVLNPHDWIGVLLEFAPLQWVGRLSYSLYLWQQLFFAVDFWRSPSMAPLQSFPLNFVMAFLCAAVSYYFVEKRLVAVGSKISRSHFR